MAMKDISVVNIGRFENGTFGVFGLPPGGADLFRVDCPELHEAITAALPRMPANYNKFLFTSRAAADEFARKQVQVEADREAARKAAADIQSQTELRRILGLPDDVLPKARFVRANGAVGIQMPGMKAPHFGAFSVDECGKFVAK